MRRFARSLHKHHGTGVSQFFLNCVNVENIKRNAVSIALNIEFPSVGKAVKALLIGDFATAAREITPELLVAFTPLVRDKVMSCSVVVLISSCWFVASLLSHR